MTDSKLTLFLLSARKKFARQIRREVRISKNGDNLRAFAEVTLAMVTEKTNEAFMFHDPSWSSDDLENAEWSLMIIFLSEVNEEIGLDHQVIFVALEFTTGYYSFACASRSDFPDITDSKIVPIISGILEKIEDEDPLFGSNTSAPNPKDFPDGTMH